MIHGTKKTTVSNMKSKFEGAVPRLHYRISYDHSNNNLVVSVVECENLPKTDVLGSSDPFVRVYLLPGQHKELKTKTMKKNTSPVFNENFKFVIPPSDVDAKTIVFQVFDYDRFSKNDPVGEVQVSLWNLNLNLTTDAWSDLGQMTGKPGVPSIIRQGRSGRGQSSSLPPVPTGGPVRSRSRSQSSSPSPSRQKSRPPPPKPPARIKYKVTYEPAVNKLTITIIECQDLPKADVTGSIDPYVRVYLMPGQHKELKTKVLNKNQNPVFNETFQFTIQAAEVEKKSVVLQVYDSDKISKDDAIGEVQLSLWTVNLTAGLLEWRDLGPVTGKAGQPVLINQHSYSTARSSTSSLSKVRSRSSSASSTASIPKFTGKARIHYKLAYDKVTENLTVTIVECQDLPKADNTGSIDPYVRVYFLPGSQHMELKTKTLKKTQNPFFNESFRIAVPVEQFGRKTVVLQVFDWDRLSKDDAIGEVQISLWNVDPNLTSNEWKELGKPTGKPGMPVLVNPPPELAPVPRPRSRNSSGSSVGAQGNARIHYKIQFEGATNNLVVTILECKNLPKADVTGSIDPYVRLYLLPGTHKETRTKVVNKNRNPNYNEIFRFPITQAEFNMKCLVLQVIDFDRFSKNDAIGEVQVPLWHLDVHFTTDEWMDLGAVTGKPGQPILLHEPLNSKTSIQSVTSTTTNKEVVREVRSRHSSTSSEDEKRPKGKARIHYRIEFDRITNNLTVTVIECKDLPKADVTGSIDPYVRIYLMPSQHTEMKTKVLNKNQNPVFNQQIKFVVAPASVENKTVVLQVFDYDRFSKNDAIGEVQISLWTLNLQQVTDEWRDLHGVTGKPGMPVLLQHGPVVPARSPATTLTMKSNTTTALVRRSRSVSASSTASSTSSADANRPRDNLGLKELNNCLIKYVDQVHNMQHSQGQRKNITVSIDRTEIDAMKGKYEEEINFWKQKYEQSEADHRRTRIELDNLHSENRRMHDSLEDKLTLLAEREKSLDSVRSELARLKAQLANLASEKEHWSSERMVLQREMNQLKADLDQTRSHLDREKIKVGELEVKLQNLVQEFEFKINILERELNMERSKTTVEVSGMGGQLNIEYERRLKAELKKLRKVYEEQLNKSREEYTIMYSKKIGELERQLAYEQRMNTTSSVEVKELTARIETLKKKLSEAEMNNLNMGRKNSELLSDMEDQAAQFRAQIAVKDREIEFLKKEIKEVKEEYERMYGIKMQEMAEVKVYSEVLVPELERMIKYSSRSQSRRRSRSRSSSGSRSASADEEEKGRGRAGRDGVFTASNGVSTYSSTTTRTAYTSHDSGSSLI